MSVTSLDTSHYRAVKPALDSKGSTPSSLTTRLLDRLAQSDALAVVEAYEVQVINRRMAYLSAPLGTPERTKARRAWLDGLHQLEAAEDQLALVIEQAGGGQHGAAQHVRDDTRRGARLIPPRA